MNNNYTQSFSRNKKQTQKLLKATGITCIILFTTLVVVAVATGEINFTFTKKGGILLGFITFFSFAFLVMYNLSQSKLFKNKLPAFQYSVKVTRTRVILANQKNEILEITRPFEIISQNSKQIKLKDNSGNEYDLFYNDDFIKFLMEVKDFRNFG